MAASITIGSLSLASDGVTLTGTLAGGTGTGYGPASGVTGLTVNATIGGFAYIIPINTTAISGTTLTAVLFSPIPTGATTTLTVATTSNLTDSGANTAQGQTGVAVTNSSTATSAITSSGAVANSLVASTVMPVSGGATSPGAHGTRNTFGFSFDSEINTTFVGTDLLLAVNFFSSATLDVTYTPTGGGTSTTVAVAMTGLGSQTAWYQQPLLSNLARGSWDVQIKIRSAVTNFWIDQTNSLVAVDRTGGTPSFAAPANTLIGAQYVTNSNLNYIICEGDVFTAEGQSTPGITHGNAKLKFRAKCTSFKLWSYLGTTTNVLLYIDGVLQSTTLIPTGSPQTNHNNGYWTVASGLDNTAFHTYELEQVGSGSNNPPVLYCFCLNLLGTGAALDTSATLTAPAPLAYLGDSITAGTFSPETLDTCYVHYTTLKNSAVAANRGVVGNKVADVVSRLSDITGLSPAASKVWVMIGANDAGCLGQTLTPIATFQSSYQTLITNLCGALPGVTCYFGYILNSGDTGLEPNLTTYNAAISAAASAAAKSNAVVVNTGQWTTTSDPLHTNATTAAKIANALAAWMATTGYTITGPAGGTSGQASSNFTVSRAVGTTFVTNESVTLTASDGTITATAAGGTITGNGTSTVTVTPAAGQTNFTFTYTPATAGTKTLTPTNSQGWTDPGAASYAAASGALRHWFGARGGSRGAIGAGRGL